MLKKIFLLNVFLVAITYSKVYIDGVGREISVPEKIERVISTVPSNTEIIIDMGLVDMLVGVDIYSEKLSDKLSGKGILNTDRLNEEKIIELMPDLVITSKHSLSKGKESLKVFDEIGIPVYVIENPKTLKAVENSIDEIGKLLNKKYESEKLKKDYIEKLKNITLDNNFKKKRVYFEILNNPIYTTGNKTFLNDVLEKAGGENIFSDEEGWISPTLEKIIEKNPQIIFVGEDRKEVVNDIKTRKEWKDIDAVKNQKIYFVDEGINRPSTRVLKSLEQIKEVLSND
ncbi:ABC transporter substrate-binding protein [Candidatus Cetobacterium colombiensis]|uniref:Helical backbone metal receptor n=1 Tax=Candidatus Cetobacterium colombiensis TaxID=3073100 RepID=A0ABU4WCT7_9FUSO|nr:helical backbone metal receptor [Candidatus Cetobacterium colombiensis]MDX8336381.1 helical backbone metal receptor [Candidatus Cetobacterium colombiensis]